MNFQEYFTNKNLRKIPKQGLHYEQKTTPDLLWCVSLAILDVTKDNRDLVFSDDEIRVSPAYNNIMQDYFSKSPQNLAENEYNKLSSYQLGLLVYAGILTQIQAHPKKYRIVNLQALEYMAVNDLSASKFLTEYTEKFLIDNNILSAFESYKNNSTQENYLIAKDKYWAWAKINTKIRGTDRKHTYRVFNKIFNVYCYKHKIPGEDGSRIKTGACPYSFLIYNRKNFRDANKPSDMTRVEYRKNVFAEVDVNGVVGLVLLQKVKDEIRRKYNGISEIQEQEFGFTPDSGVHIHHILPQHSHREFSLFKENLIALTPGQHLSYAHMQGNTHRINPDFQKVCLKRKFENIKTSLENGEDFYMLNRFIQVINSAFNLKLKEASSLDQIESVFSNI